MIEWLKGLKKLCITVWEMTNNIKVSELLYACFDMLNSKGVSYCVTNNYEDLPDIIPTDVDISIEAAHFNNLDLYIRNISFEYQVAVTQKIWHGYQKCAYILSPLEIDERFRVQLDFFVDFSARGFPNLIPNKVFLENRIPFKMFYIPSPEIEAIFIFMRRVIKNDLNARHLKKLRLLIDKQREKIEQNLTDIFGRKLSDIALRIIETGDVAEFHNKYKAYRQSLKTFSRRNTTIIYIIKNGFSQIRRALNRLTHPVGISIALLGPDGSGKSTIANMVLKRVSGSFHGGDIKYWRPYLLPAMGKLKVWNPSEEITTNPHPHDHPKQNPFKSLVRFFYYFLDYLIGYPIKVYSQKVKKKIIIFDRYYYDCLVDLHRYRFNVPSWLPRLLMPLISSPDLIIYLDAEPEEIRKRKKELSLEELQRQVTSFQKVIQMLPRAHMVKTNRPLEDVVKEIAFLILSAKAAQTEKILKRAD